MSFFEWLGRVVMLVLAGMVTLSIIGAIAAIPSGSIQAPFQIERPRVGERGQAPPAPVEVLPAPRAGEASGGTSPQSGTPPLQSDLVVAPPKASDLELWLEAITYVLLALAGIAALATIILWRMLHQRRRMADVLETIAFSRAAPAATPSPPSRA